MGNNRRMTLSEIIENKELFLDTYNIRKEFADSKYDWDDLMNIAQQYDENRRNVYPDIIQKYIADISHFDGIHSYRYRIKETDSFLKKIITKAVETGKRVTEENYLTAITDLLGIRVLYLFKEDYYRVHQQIMDRYGHQMVEGVHIKLREGDDASIYEKIMDCKPIIDQNEVYRSIHYTMCADEKDMHGVRMEIQSRTIFEEGWSEINHLLVYKDKDIQNYFVMKQASRLLSNMVGDCDSLATLMKEMYDEYYRKKAEESDMGVVDVNMDKVLMDFLNS